MIRLSETRSFLRFSFEKNIFIKIVSCSVVDPYWFQCGFRSSFLSQSGSRSRVPSQMRIRILVTKINFYVKNILGNMSKKITTKVYLIILVNFDAPDIYLKADPGTQHTCFCPFFYYSHIMFAGAWVQPCWPASVPVHGLERWRSDPVCRIQWQPYPCLAGKQTLSSVVKLVLILL